MLFLFLALLIVQRLLELNLAKQNLAWAMARGGREHGREHFATIVAMHVLWFLCFAVEAIWRTSQPNIGQPDTNQLGRLWWLWLGLFMLAQAIRYWVIATLGKQWNTRIVIVPNAKRIVSGPFRFLKHPNYLVVATEFFCGPMIFGASITAIVFTILNAYVLLKIRIPAEERALKEYTT